jgi:hypothetical protein
MNNRVLLTSCAALLHGFDTRKDPLLNALIVCYSLEQVTQGMALAALALLDDVMGNDESNTDSNAKTGNGESGNGKNWLDGGLKGLLDASSDSAVQPSCEEIANSAFEFFAELSKSVHSPPTAQSPTSISGSSDTASSNGSSSALVRSSTAVATTGTSTATDSSAGSSVSSCSDQLADSGSQDRTGKKRVWPFGLKNRKQHAAEQQPPMGHELVVQRCDHLSTGAKVVLNTVRLLRKRGASVRAAKARKAEGAYQWGGGTKKFNYLKFCLASFLCAFSLGVYGV